MEIENIDTVRAASQATAWLL